MNSLFDMDNSGAGFRLRSLQLYNWGTFHENIVTIVPEGDTTLLTGANGSGKSTIVDAVLTLLVPRSKRNYNLASGTERKSSRSPKTYIMGAFGNISDEQDGSKIQYLRPKKERCFSVLIGNFYNRGMNQTLCIAQAFWFSNEELRILYILAGKEITVQDHFDVKDNRELKRKLKKDSAITVYDTFKDYSADFSERFGLQTSRALDLFNQTVAMKSVGNLNDFVRKHMLERQDMRERINDLRSNYENLNDCHDQIVKAEMQRDHLKPLRVDAKKWEKMGLDRPRLIRYRDILPAWIAEKKSELYQVELSAKKEELGIADDEMKKRVQSLKAARTAKAELEGAKRSNAAFQRLQSLQNQEDQSKIDLDRTKHRSKSYNGLAEQIGLPANPSRKEFFESFKLAEQMKFDLLDEKKTLESKITGLEKGQVPLEIEQEKLERELESLRERKNLVPDGQIRLRKRLCRDLNIPEDELPYVCELIRVKDEAYTWQGAIERLLHNFGLRLIVPEKHYRELTRYVNQTHLNSRLQYHRTLEPDRKTPSPQHRDDLFYKLEIKSDSPFQSWITHQILTRYDYRCTDNLETLGDAKKAITATGLIRTGRTLYEKDDRRKIDDQSRFILGWENKEKVAALKKRLESILAEIDTSNEAIEDLKTQRKEIEGKIGKVSLLLEKTEFEEIDWQSIEASLAKVRIAIKELEKASDQLQMIIRQLKEKSDEINRMDLEKSSLDRKIGSLSEKTGRLKKDLENCAAILENLEQNEKVETFPAIEKSASGFFIDSIAKADESLIALLKSYNKQIEDIDAKNGKTEGRMIRTMSTFLKDYPEKSTDLRSNMDYHEDFLRFLEKIEQEDLPRHKKRFRKLLRKNVVNEISEFDNTLREKESGIRQRIDKLNNSLSLIEFNNGTHIRLNSQAVQDPEISEFKRMLRNCIPDVGSDNPEINETIFKEIKKLIDRFSSPDYERWTQKVSDVLRWLDFSVTEYEPKTQTEIERYESSSGKSGGQIVKLAYTILGAAIAYQFGLEANQVKSKSFRFVVIDEVFNNLDYRNSKYAMELFKKLDLQLMIVTPADKINVVSEYIATVNIVSRNEITNHSSLSSMTYEDFNKKWKAEQEKLKTKTIEPSL